MERKRGKCWKLPIFEGKLRVFISYLREIKIFSMFYNSSLFYHFLQLFLSFFVLEIFKFKYYNIFVRHSASASISKFEWSEQLCKVGLATSSLSQLNFSASFKVRLNFEILSFWFSCSRWTLEWMFLLYLFHLIHSSLLAYCSVLFVHGLSVFWLRSISLCFHNKYGS